jgi:hypothetical protein
MTLELFAQRLEKLEKKMIIIEAEKDAALELLQAEKTKDDKKTKKDAKKEKKDKKKADTDSDTPAKKRPLSGYLLHNKHERPALKILMQAEVDAQNLIIDAANKQLLELDDDDKPDPTPPVKIQTQHALKRLGAIWKALPEHKRQEWVDKALTEAPDDDSN